MSEFMAGKVDWGEAYPGSIPGSPGGLLELPELGQPLTEPVKKVGLHKHPLLAFQ